MSGSSQATDPGRELRAADPARDRPGVHRPDRLDRRALAWGLAASLAVHALAFLAFRGAPSVSPDGDLAAARGPEPAAPRDALQAMSLTVRRTEIRPPPRPRIDVAEPVLRARPVPRSSLPATRISLGAPPAAGFPGGRGSEARRSGGPGEGTTPAVPRSLFPEWDPPDSVRGIEVTVRVRVDARGRPTGEVELVPPTPDRAFNRRLTEKATRMEYRPARKGGVAVAGWAEITFVF